jgi:hypothetical protein
MNRLVQASSLPLNVERLLIRAALSSDFRQRLMADREAAAAEAGIELLPEERALLSHISDATLSTTIDRVILPPLPRRRFLKRPAASVVLALAGSAVLLQSACGGIAPDDPHSAYDKPGLYWANLAELRCFVAIPGLYSSARMAGGTTPVMVGFPDTAQTSLELANRWLAFCSERGISLIVADASASGLPADDVAARLPQLFEDADALWGGLSATKRVLLGWGRGAALVLQVGVRADSLLTHIQAFAGLPEPGWEASVRAAEGTRVYLRLGRQDLNAAQYQPVVEALHAAACEVDAQRLLGKQLALDECSPASAWRFVARSD